MTTKEFIEKAIKGNPSLFNYPERVKISKCGDFATMKYEDHEWDGKTKWSNTYPIHKILLSVRAWESVGKVVGWDEPLESTYDIYMHQMIDHLIEGGTIESYLETL